MFKWLVPKRHKDDPTIAEITQGIAKEAVKLESAIVTLDEEVVSMQKQRIAMNNMLDQALEIVAKKK